MADNFILDVELKECVLRALLDFRLTLFIDVAQATY